MGIFLNSISGAMAGRFLPKTVRLPVRVGHTELDGSVVWLYKVASYFKDPKPSLQGHVTGIGFPDLLMEVHATVPGGATELFSLV